MRRIPGVFMGTRMTEWVACLVVEMGTGVDEFDVVV